jgi:hypothetical protein
VKRNTLPGRPPAAGFRSRHFPRPFIDWKKSWEGRCSIADRRFGFRRWAKRSSLTSAEFGEKSPGYNGLPKEVLPTAPGLGRAVVLKGSDKFLSLRHSNSRQAKSLEQKTVRRKGVLIKFWCCIAFLGVATVNGIGGRSTVSVKREPLHWANHQERCGGQQCFWVDTACGLPDFSLKQSQRAIRRAA